MIRNGLQVTGRVDPCTEEPPVFTVRDLTVSYKAKGGERVVVADFSVQLTAGKVLGLAGETGCGKSTAALASTGFPIPSMARRTGSAELAGINLLRLSEKDLQRYWGGTIAFVPQRPSGALNPVRKVQGQFEEVIDAHKAVSVRERSDRIAEVLDEVGLGQLRGLHGRYPFEFSGGQLQRLSLAMALVCRPSVIIFDEPTTALDPTTQATIITLIHRMVCDNKISALYISHDLALLRDVCDDIAVMYAGQIVEVGSTRDVTAEPSHPYSAALMAAVPMIDKRSIAQALPGSPPDQAVLDECAFAPRCPHVLDRCRGGAVELRSFRGRSRRCVRDDLVGALLAPSQEVPGPATSGSVPLTALQAGVRLVLDVRGIDAQHGRGEGAVSVLHEVSIALKSNEIVAVVGESGSGKTTLLRVVAGLHGATRGQVQYRGELLAQSVAQRKPEVRRAIQLVFQDPAAALNPRHTVGRSLGRALAIYQPRLSRHEARAEVESALEAVRLPADFINVYPSQISGGQQQRVSLARALCAKPAVLLCDEVTSALDVSVQAGILRLIAELRSSEQLSMLFVTHDLAVVRSLADRVVVMAGGRVIEAATTEEIFAHAATPETQRLLAAAAYKTSAAFSNNPESDQPVAQ